MRSFLNTPSAISKELGSLSSLLQASPSPTGDAGLQATLMPGQEEFGSAPQKMGSTSYQPEYLSPFDAPQKMGPGNPFGQNQSVSAPTGMGRNSGSLGSPGSLGSLGGEYAVLDQYDSAFQQASAETGIPVSTLKAIAAVERGWEGTSVSGAVGIMQVMPNLWGHLGNVYDPYENIMVGARVLKSNLDQYGSMDMAIRGYLGFGTDAYGTDDMTYLARVKQFEQQLGGSGSGDLSSIFANGSVPEWGEFGGESTNGFYGYGTAYGMSGTQHTGVDVPMEVGTSYRAPMGGVVTCAGSGNGPGTDGQGCTAFTDYYGNGAGRVEVLLDNGAVLIFGHSSTSALQAGARFNAGDVLGTSGGMVSPHIHLEARVRDSSTPSGWRIVDPRTVIGGGRSFGGQQGGSMGQYGSFAQNIRNYFQNRR